MSFQFNLPREFRRAERKPSGPCGLCGGLELWSAGVGEPSIDCKLCLGYGGDGSSDLYNTECQTIDGELDVSSVNGGWILREVLNLSEREVQQGGSICISELSMRLAMFWDPSRGVLEATETRGVRGCHIVNGGRSEAQVERYLTGLQRLLDLAHDRGASEVQWG